MVVVVVVVVEGRASWGGRREGGRKWKPEGGKKGKGRGREGSERASEKWREPDPTD